MAKVSQNSAGAVRTSMGRFFIAFLFIFGFLVLNHSNIRGQRVTHSRTKRRQTRGDLSMRLDRASLLHYANRTRVLQRTFAGTIFRGIALGMPLIPRDGKMFGPSLNIKFRSEF